MPMYQLGIDVSKNTLDLCLLREGIKGRIKTRKLKNTADAAKVVTEWLKRGRLRKRKIKHAKPVAAVAMA